MKKIYNWEKATVFDLESDGLLREATKIRWTGKTGIAGKYYYDCDTHTLHDLDDYLSKGGCPGF